MLSRCAQPSNMNIDPLLADKLEQIVSRIFSGDVTVAADIEKLTEHEANLLDQMYAMHFLFSESAKYRGRVIDITIFVEMSLATVLSKYFSEKNQKKEAQLNAYVFDRMPLSQKLMLLKNVLKDSYPELASKYSTDLAEIGRLVEFRNNIAHSMLNSNAEYLGKVSERLKKIRTETSQQKAFEDIQEIEITYYQNGKVTTKRITRKDIDNHHSSCIEKASMLQKLSQEL